MEVTEKARHPIGIVNTLTVLILLAEALGAIGRLEEALATLVETAESILHGGQRCYEAELLRLKGELLMRTGAVNREAEAESLFQQAIAIAWRQSAKSWELRAFWQANDDDPGVHQIVLRLMFHERLLPMFDSVMYACRKWRKSVCKKSSRRLASLRGVRPRR